MWTEFYEQYVTSKGSANASGYISCKCPFHSDRHASAGYNKDSGVFHCFACEDGTSWTPVSFLVSLLGISWHEASYLVDQYRSEHGMVERDSTKPAKMIVAKPAWEKLVEEARGNLSEQVVMVQEYLNTRGIRFEALVKAGVGFLPASQTEWGRDSLIFPYTYNGKVCGVRLRDELGNKRAMTGSHMTLWGIDNINDTTKTVIIAEGESDCLRLMSEIDDEAIVILSTPGNQFSKDWTREFQGIERVIVVPQADEASKNLVATTTANLKSKVVVVSLPWKRRQTGKDICDWMHYNDGDTLRKLLNNAGGLFRSQAMDGWELEARALVSKDKSPLVSKLLKRQQLALIVGPEKALKTWFALNIARTVTHPEYPFLGIDSYTGPAVPGNVLIIEEEGTVEDLNDRAQMVFHDVPNWRSQVTWWHRRGVRLDEDAWIEEIESTCEQKNVSLLILDPMQDLHGASNENDASEMAPFWHNIRRLMMRFPEMSIILIHHFNKTGVIESKWKAIRGSSRTGGTADLGFFLERKVVKDEPTRIVRFCMDGRELKDNLAPNGKEVFEVVFGQNGVFHYENAPKISRQDKADIFYGEMKQRGSWSVNEAQALLDCSLRSLKMWIDKNDDITLDKSGRIFYEG